MRIKRVIGLALLLCLLLTACGGREAEDSRVAARRDQHSRYSI